MKKYLFLGATTFLLFPSVSSFANDWSAYFNNDEMRGTAQKFVRSVSDNSVDFDFPYNGGSQMTIVLRSKKVMLKEGQKPDNLKPTEAVLVMSKGQFLCNSFNDCHISVKFDDGKIQQYSMTEAADGSADVIFFENSASFIKNVSSHKKLIIEAEFYQAGNKQFKFDLTGYSSPKVEQ
jgi:hypothetical protein